MDPLIPMTAVRSMRGYVDEAMAPTRFALVLIGVFGVSALVLAGVAFAFLAIAAVACAVPALRATRVDPPVALRED